MVPTRVTITGTNGVQVKIQVGDLVKVEPWDCEGIEQPWGWDPNRIGSKVTSKAMSRQLRRTIRGGSDALVVDTFDYENDEGSTAEHFTLVVEGKRLVVPVRFLHKIT
jgi:hypothetical protein